MMRSLLLTLILIATALTGVAAETDAADIQALETKASRLFDQKEWASAEAMYTLLIDRVPDRAAYYGRAVVSASMREIASPSFKTQNAAFQKSLLTKALKSRVVIDSLFKAVEQSAFELGHAGIYETFMERAAENEPWLSRKISSMMLSYFTFRRNGEAMVEYSTRLLETTPDSENLLLSRAEGLMLIGCEDEAREAFAGALRVNPSSVKALLYLGEMALDRGNDAEALDYLSRANSLAPTPRLAATISLLSQPSAR